MRTGRPTVASIVDPQRVGRTKAGNIFIHRKPRVGDEGVWCRELVERYDAWRDLVDMKPATKIEIERCILPGGMRAVTGAVRADAIIWHGDSECSILEAKTECGAIAVASGIGQLMYYRAAVEAYWGVKVHALLLAAPQLPPLIIDAIANSTAPIRFLKRDDADNLSGLVPSYA